MEKEQFRGMTGHFVWSFGKEFFIETQKGNFVWNDPDYGGDNTVRQFQGDLKKWLKEMQIPYCRDKGTRFIENFIDESFIFIQ